ncbi:MAG: peptidylprolyl isomerase [Rhodocyclaceae bacterium]|nr:peptidylprolyl isomerase [Rhodocyclaceae bacterium]
MFGTLFNRVKMACAGSLAIAVNFVAIAADGEAPKTPKTTAEIIAAAPASDWRDVAASDLLVMDLTQGQIFIELATRFAPLHSANIRTLSHQGFFDGLAIMRVQDNYVTQWGDPNDDDPKLAKSLGDAKTKLPAEFFIPFKGLPITPIKDVDGWAPVTGYVDGFPVAADPKKNKAWLTHCYGMVGAARGQPTDSSNGTGLYAIIGHAPRGLDLNITVVGRVLRGMEYLSALPRGGATMGFYDKPEHYVGITKVRLASDISEAERPKLEVLKTDSKSWASVLDSRRNRSGWFVHSFGHTEVCASSVPVRNKPAQ